MNGSFIISLDFEMMWGNLEKYSPETYGTSNVSRVRGVIERLIALFNKYHVKSTFATVGLLMCNDTKEALEYVPCLKPTYQKTLLSPYNDNMLANISEEYSHLYFAADVVDELSVIPLVEIGTHTFGHFFCWEPGQTVDQFEDDIKSAVGLAQKKGLVLKSIVFPRNQVSMDYLKICSKYGLKTYRGNSLNLYKRPKNVVHNFIQRGLRFLDAYINVTGSSSVPYDMIEVDAQPMNIPASRFFRPCGAKISFADRMRIRRIKNEMTYAAKHNELYHLWWHPHNFGANLETNVCALEQLLHHFAYLRNQYGMQSYTMSEFADEIKEGK